MKKILYISAIAAIISGSCARHQHNEHEHHHGEHTEEHHHEHEGECDEHHHDGHHHEHDGECDEHHHGTHDEHAEAAHGDEIIFTAAQAARTDFEVTEAAIQPFSEIIHCSGTLQESQNGRAVIASPVSGRVVFERNLSAGSAVEKGETLFHIDTKSFTGGDAAAKARAEYEQARAAYERAASLYDSRVVSQKELDAARAAYERAAAEYAPFATDSEKGIAIKAPQSGYIATLSVSGGEYAGEGTTLAVIADGRRMRLTADVPQRYYSKIQNIAGANITVDDGKTYALSELNGQVVARGKSASAGSAAIPVAFEFDTPAELAPGMFVEVSLLGAPVEGVIVLPLTAITEAQGVYYVYVQLDEEGYQRREVKLGGNDGLRVAIAEGLQPGERVVTRGAVQVKMAAASGAIPHGHSHNH